MIRLKILCGEIERHEAFKKSKKPPHNQEQIPTNNHLESIESASSRNKTFHIQAKNHPSTPKKSHYLASVTLITHLADVGFNSMISNDFFNLWPTQKQTLPAPRKDVNSKSRHCTANRNNRKPVPNSIKFSFFTTGFQCNKLDQIVTLTLIRRNCASGFTICDVSTAHDLRASDNPYPQQVSKS